MGAASEVVVGVLGQWASGKSTAAKSLVDHLGGEEEVIFITDRVLLGRHVVNYVLGREEAEVIWAIEADGSRQKPLKAPAEHEPAIPGFVKHFVQVVGLTGLGKPLNEEYVHRPEIFVRLSELEFGETVTSEALVRVLTHPDGGLKNIPENARRIVLLNQADTPELQSQADSITKRLLPI